jgi:hypothetical protein
MIITNPLLLIDGGSLGSEFLSPISIDTVARTISISPGSGILPLTTDGISGQALYSALKLLWKNNSTYLKLPFPMESITPEQFEIINGWSWGDLVTRKALRSCGWAERNIDGNITAMWAGIITLGEIGNADQPYFQQDSESASAVNFSFPGAINEAIQILSDPTGGGDFSGGFTRRAYFKIFARVPGKTYSTSSLTEIGVTNMTYIAYRFPLSNSIDPNLLTDDAGIVANPSVYSGINVTYYSSDQVRNIGGINHNFRVIISGDRKNIYEIYTKIQYLLRQDTNINSEADIRIGKVSDHLFRFIGDRLYTSRGVYIDNFDQTDINNYTFTDVSGEEKTFPYVATGTIAFNSNLVNDIDAVYRMYFTSTPAGDYGTDNAVLVKNITNDDISGSINGDSTVSFSFDYDSNAQGGRTAGTDANITLVAIGLNTGQFVSATGTIRRDTNQNFSLVAARDRVFTV